MSQMDDAGRWQICENLVTGILQLTPPPPLVHLDLQSFSGQSVDICDVGQWIMTSITESNINTLRYFNIANNSSWFTVNPENYDNIATVISQNPNLEYINISYNNYYTNKATSLLETMNQNLENQPELYGGLQELHMSGFDWDMDDTLQELVCLISDTPSLRKFSCSA